MPNIEFINRRSVGLINTALLVMCMFFYNCTDQRKQNLQPGEIIQASLNALGNKKDRKKVRNLMSLADCMSLNGKYSTEMHTAFGGYSWFKQSFSYRPKPFEAIIENRNTGFQIGDSIMPLNKEAVYAIRSHEFHNLLLEVDQRFHDFGEPTEVEGEGMSMYKLKVKDELNKEGLLFFDIKTCLLAAIHFQNPDDAKEIIKIKFSRWKKVQDLLLPWYVAIDQSGKLYSFNFTNISFNSPGFKYKSVKK